MNAYSTPEQTTAFMQHLEDNHVRIQGLLKQMKCDNEPLYAKTMAFTELFMLMNGDPHRQRRLVRELEVEAEKERNRKLKEDAHVKHDND